MRVPETSFESLRTVRKYTTTLLVAGLAILASCESNKVSSPENNNGNISTTPAEVFDEQEASHIPGTICVGIGEKALQLNRDTSLEDNIKNYIVDNLRQQGAVTMEEDSPETQICAEQISEQVLNDPANSGYNNDSSMLIVPDKVQMSLP